MVKQKTVVTMNKQGGSFTSFAYNPRFHCKFKLSVTV